jgi:hypothetical protein
MKVLICGLIKIPLVLLLGLFCFFFFKQSKPAKKASPIKDI